MSAKWGIRRNLALWNETGKATERDRYRKKKHMETVYAFQMFWIIFGNKSCSCRIFSFQEAWNIFLLVSSAVVGVWRNEFPARLFYPYLHTRTGMIRKTEPCHTDWNVLFIKTSLLDWHLSNIGSWENKWEQLGTERIKPMNIELWHTIRSRSFMFKIIYISKAY